MNIFIGWKKTPAEYADTLRRAYQRVLRREPYDEELRYWQAQPALPYVLVAAAIDNWARRNQPGLTVTGGQATLDPNCRLLSVAILTPALAEEARQAIGLPSLGDALGRAVFQRNVVAVGAEMLASNGGVHFVAAGSPEARR